MNKAHIKFLENALFDITRSVNRYSIVNTTVPTQSSISESDRAEMEEYIENVKILINTLGHKVFEEKREAKTPKEFEQKTFYIQSARGANASGETTADGFLIHKESEVATSTVPSITPNFVKLRNELLENGTIIAKDEKLIVKEDYLCSSPSTAAVIVMGRNANGLIEWKLKDGTTLKDYETTEK